MKLLKTLWSDESGQDLVEYGLLLALVALAATAALNSMGQAVLKLFDAAAGTLTNATT
jgi:pilus assembly protein Flp/PilA